MRSLSWLAAETCNDVGRPSGTSRVSDTRQRRWRRQGAVTALVGRGVADVDTLVSTGVLTSPFKGRHLQIA